MRFSGWELVIILVIILLLFGARKLPDLARSLGASAKEFRKGVDEGSTEEVTVVESAKATAAEPEKATAAEPEKKID
jgi:sec-independent protein translocase protein TatA